MPKNVIKCHNVWQNNYFWVSELHAHTCTRHLTSPRLDCSIPLARHVLENKLIKRQKNFKMLHLQAKSKKTKDIIKLERGCQENEWKLFVSSLRLIDSRNEFFRVFIFPLNAKTGLLERKAKNWYIIKIWELYLESRVPKWSFISSGSLLRQILRAQWMTARISSLIFKMYSQEPYI